MNKLLIYGAGGLGREVAEFLLEQNADLEIEFVVDQTYFRNVQVDGHKLVLDTSIIKGDNIIIAIGDPVSRSRVSDKITVAVQYKSLRHKTAYVSKNVLIGEGAIIAPGVVVSINCILGRHVLLNYNCTLGHDVQLGDFVSVFPGATISGNVVIGDRVTIGANSSIREGLRIASDIIVGMGAVVLHDLNEPGTYVGNPLRKLD
jgi:sugar O-acyltransferase (sialic acid O-acetyltransferase NeuD family)